MNKNIGGIIVLGLILVGGSFYGGMLYGKSIVPANAGPGRFQGQFSGQLGGSGQGGFRNGGSGRGGFGGDAVVGEILSKDASSLTVKLVNGGTKLVVYSTSTPIRMTTDGSLSDLSVGKYVTISGASNPDGSVTARTIQLRPNLPTSTVPGSF